MMIIKIGFDPETLKLEDEAHPAFQFGGVVLKIWALYKKSFVTSQHFRESLIKFGMMLARANDPDDLEAQPYTNLDDFVAWLGICGFYGVRSGLLHGEMRTWVLNNWDYFNPSIQRDLCIEFERMEPVTKQIFCNPQPKASYEAKDIKEPD